MVLQGSRIDAHKADQLRSTGSTMYIGDVGIRNWNRRHSQANHNRAPPSLDTAGTEQFSKYNINHVLQERINAN